MFNLTNPGLIGLEIWLNICERKVEENTDTAHPHIREYADGFYVDVDVVRSIKHRRWGNGVEHSRLISRRNEFESRLDLKFRSQRNIAVTDSRRDFVLAFYSNQCSIFLINFQIPILGCM